MAAGNGNYNSYTYDTNGLRRSKFHNGTTYNYVWTDGNLTHQTDSAGNTWHFYYSDGQVIGFQYNGNDYTYVKNIQGDVIGILDASGAVVANYTYDAWGMMLTSSGTMSDVNPIRYRGYYYDVETGWYYLQSRYYDPVLRRFINADGTEQLLNSETSICITQLYGYCNNSPIIYHDPEGNIPQTISNFISHLKSMAIHVPKANKRVDTRTRVSLLIGSADADRGKILRNDLKKVSNNLYLDFYVTDSRQEIANTWNAIGDQEIVIMMFHGEPGKIGGVSIQYVREAFKFKRIKCLILISCNVGFSGRRFANIAYELYKKISGVVVASDGTVKYQKTLLGYELKSLNDKAYKDDCKRFNYTCKKNYGWLVYVHEENVNVCYTTNLYTITLNSMLRYLISNNLLPKSSPIELIERSWGLL